MSAINSSARSAIGDDSALAAASRGVRRYGSSVESTRDPHFEKSSKSDGGEKRRDGDREIAVGAQHERERARAE